MNLATILKEACSGLSENSLEVSNASNDQGMGRYNIGIRALGVEMPPRTRATSRGIRGFNAPDDDTEGSRASFFRSSGRSGLRGRITGPQGSQSFSERRVGTNFGDIGGDYPEGVHQSNDTMGSSFEDSDYQLYEEIDRGDVMVTLGEFMKLKPPSFSGAKSIEDPQVFLDEMDKISIALGYSSHRAVELTGFMLTEVAQIWFATLKSCRPPGSTPLTWEEFTQAFIDRFLPESVRDDKEQEFETLMQALGMIVSDYDIQFTQLSRYAPYLVQTERERIKRFIKGLHKLIYKILVSKRFTSYLEVVDAARKIEVGHAEVGVERDKSKRNRGEGFSRYKDPSRGKDVNIAGQQDKVVSGVLFALFVVRFIQGHEMARGSIRPDFATTQTKNVIRDKGKGVASSSQGRSTRPTQQGAFEGGQARVFALTP
ncbi:Uncharacterized protein TCM_003164 [Theobroma cacao]|uniref:Retrotransposon gag domain-containing protein n=1 Tax=Theobroma cacao TaxID=3641 RepID=A0A061DPQ5_THECC|nr:Uncharacterized protein TCM_003164 [Theobroma cacao]